MDDLIEALQIFRKYSNTKYPTHCEHDVLYICGGIEVSEVSVSDKKKLEELGFVEDIDGGFSSFRFGSC